MLPIETNAPSGRPAVPLSVSGALVPCYLGFDLLAPGIIEAGHSEHVAAVVLGIILAQFGLLAVWAVLGPWPWFMRQPVAMFGVASALGARDVMNGTFWILAYAGGGTMALVVSLTSVFGGRGVDVLMATELFTVSLAGSMHGILVALRLADFVLQRASERPTAP